MNILTENILTAWAEASQPQVARGRGWYQAAHDLAWIIANGDVVTGAGVIAALSPQKSWDVNRRLAINACMHGDITGQVGDAVAKAKAILAGNNPGLVLPEGKKTWHFFHNILRPDDQEFVTVDRHAYRVATSEWDNASPRISMARYAQIVSAYQDAAKILREAPSTVQAVTWVYARER